MSVPVACWVSPMAQSVDVRGPRAYISAACADPLSGDAGDSGPSPGCTAYRGFAPSSNSWVRSLMNVGVGEPCLDDVGAACC